MPNPTPMPESSEHDWQQTDALSWLMWPICRICGVVQRRDGKNAPCKGPWKMRQMERREEPPR